MRDPSSALTTLNKDLQCTIITNTNIRTGLMHHQKNRNNQTQQQSQRSQASRRLLIRPRNRTTLHMSTNPVVREMTTRENPTAQAVSIAKPGLGLIGFLVVEMIIGYEWFISGLVKFVRGGFPSGLASALVEKAASAVGWYGNFLTSAVIPNAVAFGYAVEWSELLAGLVFLAGPLIWIFAWHRISDRVRLLVLFFTAVSAIGGVFLAINLHLANAASHPWLLPRDGFDEGIDLDSVLPAIQVVIATVSINVFKRIRRANSDNAHLQGKS